MKIWINGKLYDKELATVSVFDHGLLYGDGIFEGIRIYNERVFKLKEHITRLYASAKAIMLDIGMQKSDMIQAVEDTVKANEKIDGYIRLVVTRGVGDLGINPATGKKATIIIIVGDISVYPKEHYSKGIAIITSSVRRISPHQFDTRIKSLNYLNNILAKMEANNAGCMEALMLNAEGYIAECTADNIFAVRKGQIASPHRSGSNLEGITRGTVIDAAKRLGIPTEETALTQYDMYTADECFMTGTGAEIMPVTKIDGRVIGNGTPGIITESLQKEFWKIVKEQCG
jgi:branched-chain amino acid aminotransferase